MIDYLTSNLWQCWVFVAVMLLAFELTSGTLYLLCFSIGAFAVALLSVFTDSVALQLLVLSVISAVSVFLVRPVLMEGLHKNGKKSNVDALIGRTGRVSETIVANGYGRVAIDGDDWKALSADGSEIPSGKQVTVVSRESLIITVIPNL